jgi:hypothetical protein
MIICAAGEIHGAMDQMYDDVLAFESTLGVPFEWVLHVGDFGWNRSRGSAALRSARAPQLV